MRAFGRSFIDGELVTWERAPGCTFQVKSTIDAPRGWLYNIERVSGVMPVVFGGLPQVWYQVRAEEMEAV